MPLTRLYTDTNTLILMHSNYAMLLDELGYPSTKIVLRTPGIRRVHTFKAYYYMINPIHS